MLVYIIINDMFRSISPCIFLAVVASLPCRAQVESILQKDIPVLPFSSARSSVFSLKAGEQVVVRIDGSEQLDVDVSLFTAEHDLVQKDDRDVPRPSFEYLIKRDGNYYVTARNVSAVDGTFSVFVRQGAKVVTADGNALAIVRVFYATNRKASPQIDRAPYFLNEPSGKNDFSVGECDVRIPRNHKLGELESTSILRLDFRDVNGGVRVENVRLEPDLKKFFAEISDKSRQSADREAFVFVHGFNVSFEDAARRTAQVSYDLAFAGAPILFSWPSHASAMSYEDDKRRADASVGALKLFLRELAATSGIRTVHLLAHSMGNRILVQALEQLSDENAPMRFKNAILLAPDLDAEALRRIAEKIHDAASRVTLYTSSRDLALKLSQWKANSARAGNHVVMSADLETIDASAANTELSSWSHSYFGDSAMVLGDLFHLLRGDPPDLRFGLDRVCPDGDCEAGRYWRFRAIAR
jgi:esterase/lipase superfamily enzyme